MTINVNALHKSMNARGRRAMFRPELQRTSTKFVMRRPHWGNRREFAEKMGGLAEFQFDSRRNYWTAPLTAESYNKAQMVVRMRLSDGVLEWLDGMIEGDKGLVQESEGEVK